jgi:simple sugar transport system ATP-binding protein
MRTYRGSTLRTRLVTQRGKGRSYAKRMVSEARVEVADVHVPIAHLSGGNQQRLVARREAWSSGCMLVAAQPTRGLDFKAAGEVRQLLLDRRAEGCAVLMVSDDLDEIFAMSDRVVVMYDGQIAGAFPVESANRQEVGFLMGGGHLRAHASAGEVA